MSRYDYDSRDLDGDDDLELDPSGGYEEDYDDYADEFDDEPDYDYSPWQGEDDEDIRLW